jgi:hypothetical protein
MDRTNITLLLTAVSALWVGRILGRLSLHGPIFWMDWIVAAVLIAATIANIWFIKKRSRERPTPQRVLSSGAGRSKTTNLPPARYNGADRESPPPSGQRRKGN